MKKIMLFLAVAGIMAACNNDNEVLNEPQYITEFKAVFGGADSRIAAEASAAGLKFAWNDEDVLDVVSSDLEEYHEYTYNAATGKFELEYGEGMTAGTQYIAFRDLEPDDEGGFEGELYYQNNILDPAIDIPLISKEFTADADGTIAEMHHIVGMVEVPVELAAASEIKNLKGVGIFVDGAKVVGPFSAKPEAPYFVDKIEGVDDYSMSITNREETLNTTTPVSYFIPMLPGTYLNPELHYYYENGSVTKQLTGTLTIECGKVTKLPEQEVTLN